ncbi:MAG: DUF5320 domain-containing protein [Desulfobacterales bacterium]|nr:DUF5320 domain-containing protein [Desulfobacterales bacterium]
MCCGTQKHQPGFFNQPGAGFGWANLHCGPCFSTKEEKIAWLEQCQEGLQEALKTVEERIAKLKKDK